MPPKNRIRMGLENGFDAVDEGERPRRHKRNGERFATVRDGEKFDPNVLGGSVANLMSSAMPPDASGRARDDSRCAWCGAAPAATKALMVCARCRGAAFCDRTCFKAAWKATGERGHKQYFSPRGASEDGVAATPWLRRGYSAETRRTPQVLLLARRARRLHRQKPTKRGGRLRRHLARGGVLGAPDHRRARPGRDTRHHHRVDGWTSGQVHRRSSLRGHPTGLRHQVHGIGYEGARIATRAGDSPETRGPPRRGRPRVL